MKQLTKEKIKRITTAELEKEKERLEQMVTVDETSFGSKDVIRLEVIRGELARRYSK